MTYRSRGRSIFEVIFAVVFVGFLVGFISVLCIGNYYRAKRAMERQRERRLSSSAASHRQSSRKRNHGRDSHGREDHGGDSSEVGTRISQEESLFYEEEESLVPSRWERGDTSNGNVDYLDPPPQDLLTHRNPISLPPNQNQNQHQHQNPSQHQSQNQIQRRGMRMAHEEDVNHQNGDLISI